MMHWTVRLGRVARASALAATATCLPSGHALAADLIGSPEPVAVPFTWTGPYFGIQAGYLGGDVDAAGTEGDADAFIGGVHLGYDHQFSGILGGGLVVGAFADLDFATEGSIEVGGVDIGEVDYVARGMAKVGFGLDRALLYAQGGVAYLGAEVPALDDPDLNEFGWSAGVGVDYAITNKLAVGADYLYHEFDDVGSGTDQFATDGVDVDAHTFRAKFRYKF